MVIPVVVSFIVLIGIVGMAAVADLSRSEPAFGAPAREFDPIRAIAPSGRRGYLADLAVLVGCGLAITRVMGIW
jgi:hypothetical protein